MSIDNKTQNTWYRNLRQDPKAMFIVILCVAFGALFSAFIYFIDQSFRENRKTLDKLIDDKLEKKVNEKIDPVLDQVSSTVDAVDTTLRNVNNSQNQNPDKK